MIQMDMSLSSMMAMNLQSLQSSISMVTMDKAMNQDSALMGEMLQDFSQANPVSNVAVPSGSLGSQMDTYA